MRPPALNLADCCDRWAGLPLLFQPGTEWNYGVSTDVLGRVVEVVSGMSLDRFFDERIFAPLKMVDTGFFVRDDQADRAARLYGTHPATGKAVINPLEHTARSLPDVVSGGGGLWGTATDYLRFCNMMLNRGELDGVRLLGSRTVDYMTRNHLPGGADVETFGRQLVGGDGIRRGRIRARLLGLARPGPHPRPRIGWGVRMGRRRQHRRSGATRRNRSPSCS